MGFKVLITIDLLSATPDQGSRFNEELELKEWVKIKTLTNSWTYAYNFNDEIRHWATYGLIKQDLLDVIAKVGISKIECAFLMSTENINYETVEYHFKN